MDAKLNQAQVRETYRQFARTYDIWGNLMESRARRCCLELADIKNGESVLEVAVGTGILFEKLLQLNPNGRNEGIDITEAMLHRAKLRARKSGAVAYVLKIGDAYHLDYPNDCFDVLLNNYMFDLIPEQDFATILAEYKRVLCPGGRLVLVNMTKGSRWFNAMWEFLYKIRPSLLGGCRSVELAPYLKKAGFIKVQRQYVSQLGFPSEVNYGVKP